MIHKNVIVWEIACARMMVISRRACTSCYSLTPRDTCLHLTTTSSNVVVQVFPDASRDDGRARSFRIFTSRDTKEKERGRLLGFIEWSVRIYPCKARRGMQMLQGGCNLRSFKSLIDVT